MKLIIEIPEDSYKATCNGCMSPPDVENAVNAIKQGTPLPEHHGRLIDANNLKQAFISWSMAVQGLFNDADIASIIDNAPTIIDAEEGNNVSA